MTSDYYNLVEKIVFKENLTVALNIRYLTTFSHTKKKDTN